MYEKIMGEATLRAKNQITMPKLALELLNVKIGEKIRVELNDDGYLVLHKVVSRKIVRNFKKGNGGMLKQKSTKAVDGDEGNKVIANKKNDDLRKPDDRKRKNTGSGRATALT